MCATVWINIYYILLYIGGTQFLTGNLRLRVGVLQYDLCFCTIPNSICSRHRHYPHSYSYLALSASDSISKKNVDQTQVEWLRPNQIRSHPARMFLFFFRSRVLTTDQMRVAWDDKLEPKPKFPPQRSARLNQTQYSSNHRLRADIPMVHGLSRQHSKTTAAISAAVAAFLFLSKD